MAEDPAVRRRPSRVAEAARAGNPATGGRVGDREGSLTGHGEKRQSASKTATRGVGAGASRRRTVGTPVARGKASRKDVSRKTAVTSGPKTAATKKPAGRAAARKYVYFFGAGKADGDRSMKDLLGGKGAGLAEMTNAGLPVPPGFTITTEACNLYYTNHHRVPAAVDKEMIDQLGQLEQTANASFGSGERPLLLSVRARNSRCPA